MAVWLQTLREPQANQSLASSTTIRVLLRQLSKPKDLHTRSFRDLLQRIGLLLLSAMPPLVAFKPKWSWRPAATSSRLFTPLPSSPQT